MNPLARALLIALITAVAVPGAVRAAGAAAQGESAESADATTVEPVTLPAELVVPANVDHTPGLPDEQRDSALAILDAARGQDSAAQRRWAERLAAEQARRLGQPPTPGRPATTSWLDVMRNPDRYRGELVVMRGRILSATPVEADANPLGLERLYEVTLRPHDSERNPTFALAAAVPAGMPLGGDINEEGEVVGYFFKLRRYEVDGEDRAAPLVLAATIDWSPPVVADPARLSEALLAQVKNFTRGIGEVEEEAYYRGLAQARDVDPAALRAAAAAFRTEREAAQKANPKTARFEYSPYVDMFRKSDEVQGRPFSLFGHIREVKSYPASENDFGIKTLHELWLYTDKASNNPVVVVCTELPEGLPTPGRNEAVDGIRATGYFLKMYGYKAEDTTRVAPLLLAHRIEWTPLAPETFPPWLKNGLLIGALTLVGLLVVFQTRAFRRDRARARERESGEPISGTDLQSLLSDAGSGPTPTAFGAPADTTVETDARTNGARGGDDAS